MSGVDMLSPACMGCLTTTTPTPDTHESGALLVLAMVLTGTSPSELAICLCSRHAQVLATILTDRKIKQWPPA